MNKKTRTILFLICLFLFLLIAPLAVFYSLGYRFNLDSKKIVQTGAFYFKVWPKNVEVFLDGKFKKKTDFLFGSGYIDNLLPKEYTVEIKKEGFHPWEKTLEIKEKQVTESKNVFLVPENPNFVLLTKGVEDFFFSPDEKSVVFKRVDDSGWTLSLLKLGEGLESDLFSEKTEIEFLDLKFSSDSKKIILKTEEKKGVKYWILELPTVPTQDKTPVNLISLDFLGKEVEKIYFNPENSQKIFFSKESLGENVLFEANFLTKEVGFEPILKNLITYEVSDGDLFWISKAGFLFKTDFSGQIEEKLSLGSFPLKSGGEYQIYLKLPRILLMEDNILYLFNSETKTFEKFFEPVKGLRFSPDEKKMVFFNDYEIWVLFLEEKYDQPQKKALDKLFLTRYSEKIDEVFWYTSHYLVFNTGDRIKIAEIDDRNRINIYDLPTVHTQAEFKNPKIFFNQFDKKLYILSEGNLFSSDKMLP